MASVRGEGGIALWDARTGAHRMDLLVHPRTVSALAFSPDGKRLVSGSMDCTLKIIEPVSGMELLNLGGHQSTVMDVAVSADGEAIFSIESDGTAIVWRAPRE
jgi:WD40 repeat protein